MKTKNATAGNDALQLSDEVNEDEDEDDDDENYSDEEIAVDPDDDGDDDDVTNRFTDKILNQKQGQLH